MPFTKSSLWATETPTARKVPISGADGRIAQGWLPITNYADYTIVSTDTTLDATHAIVVVDAAANLTLPDPSTCDHRVYNVVRIGTGDVTLVGTISGDTNLTLTSQWDSVVVLATTAGWIRCS